MEFIKDLHEARMTRGSSNQKVLSYTDCCERTYLIVLTLELLRRFPTGARVARSYAKQTSGYDSYKHYRMNGTDLYNFVHFVTGDDETISKLKDPKRALAIRQRTTMPLMQFNRYVTKMSNGTAPSVDDTQVLIKLESALNITNADYKNIRRAVSNFNRLSTKDKQDVATRLLLAGRAKLRSSDIITHLEEIVNDRDLETKRIEDPEPTVSVPDMATTAQDINLYRYLVGSKNLMLTKKFLELVKDGKSIPSNVAQAYLPAVTALDDIVKGGPAYVNLLRQLQKRAKSAPKR